MWLRIKATGQGIDIINPAVAKAMLDGGTAERIEPKDRKGKKVETASIQPPRNAARERPVAHVVGEEVTAEV